jgi:hypothetical protein
MPTCKKTWKSRQKLGVQFWINLKILKKIDQKIKVLAHSEISKSVKIYFLSYFQPL